MPDPHDWQLIDRYLAGEAAPDEIALVHARTRSDPAWAQALELLRANFATEQPASSQTDEAWTRFQSRLGSPKRQSSRSAASPKHHWLRIAAAILVMAGSITSWRVIGSRRAQPNASSAMTEIATPNGSRRTVTLLDGSRVTLNAGSRLRWGPDFGTRTRDVFLDGEAYFTVVHDSTRPFRAHARGAVAHDLGTRFTVRAYPELAHVEVMVAEGTVSLRHDRDAADSTVLTTGQLGRLGVAERPTVESGVPVDRWTAWTTGSLVLDGLTLADAVPQLERWYDVTMRVTDSSLARRRIQARFHDEPLPQVLDALALALGAQWSQTGHAVTIDPTSR